jgi:hypothetical protein
MQIRLKYFGVKQNQGVKIQTASNQALYLYELCQILERTLKCKKLERV